MQPAADRRPDASAALALSTWPAKPMSKAIDDLQDVEWMGRKYPREQSRAPSTSPLITVTAADPLLQQGQVDGQLTQLGLTNCTPTGSGRHHPAAAVFPGPDRVNQSSAALRSDSAGEPEALVSQLNFLM